MEALLHKLNVGILKLLKTSLFMILLQNYTVMYFFFFSVDGQLRHIHTGEPFVFNYKEDLHRWNQKRYEALGEVMLIIFFFLKGHKNVILCYLYKSVCEIMYAIIQYYKTSLSIDLFIYTTF